MNDELIFNNYLMNLKSTVEVYVHGTLESSNEDVRNLLKSGLDETMKHQARVYDTMVSEGWYVIENTDCKTICDTLNKILEND